MPDIKRIKEEGNYLLDCISRAMDGVNWEFLIDLANILPRMKRTFVTGAGRSGLVARSFGMRLMHAGLPAYIPGETITPAAQKGDLLVALSCTGQTGYTAYIAKRAKELGAMVVIITAEPDSPLTEVSDKTLIIPENESNIVLKAAVFEHTVSLCLDALFNVLSKKLKIDLDEFRKRHANLE
jgi:6-phospho 3-hexuloisomerase